MWCWDDIGKVDIAHTTASLYKCHTLLVPKGSSNRSHRIHATSSPLLLYSTTVHHVYDIHWVASPGDHHTVITTVSSTLQPPSTHQPSYHQSPPLPSSSQPSITLHPRCGDTDIIIDCILMFRRPFISHLATISLPSYILHATIICHLHSLVCHCRTHVGCMHLVAVRCKSSLQTDNDRGNDTYKCHRRASGLLE